MLGYKCCLPVHQHELKGIMDNYYQKVDESIRRQTEDQRAQVLEYLKQLNADQKIIEVRLVK